MDGPICHIYGVYIIWCYEFMPFGQKRLDFCLTLILGKSEFIYKVKENES